MTLVPSSLRIDPGILDSFDIQKAHERLRRWIIRSGLGDLTMIGTMGLTWVEHLDNDWAPCWSPRWRLLVTGTSVERLHAALDHYLPADEVVRKPIRVRRTALDLNLTASLWDLRFERRVSFVTYQDRPAVGVLALRDAQVRELARFLDAHHAVDRLFCRNVRRYGWKLVPLVEPRTSAPVVMPSSRLKRAASTTTR